MDKKHPVVAVTGSSGAGTTTVKVAFDHIFNREGINAAFVEGDSFHRYDRVEMRTAVSKAENEGRTLSHFGPEANLLTDLEGLFVDYAATGTGRLRNYVHSEEEAKLYGTPPGTFTEWRDMAPGSDLLFYEGLHGGFVGDVNVADKVDLLIGVVPIVNLEWIQKIHRDSNMRGYDSADVTHTILRRMSDYVHYITPQFSLTDINFQRVPTVDTSNPFVARDVPTLDESYVVIRFKDPKKFEVDFPYLLAMLHDSFMSRRNTIVVPGGKWGVAIELILTPIVKRLIEQAQ
ncbi:MAG: phosphoribulokinase [Acidimicrobiales bacterium]|jgi:phosphoribulokinase